MEREEWLLVHFSSLVVRECSRELVCPVSVVVELVEMTFGVETFLNVRTTISGANCNVRVLVTLGNSSSYHFRLVSNYAVVKQIL